MSFEVMLRQLGAGFGQTCLIFILTLVFSSAAWNGCIFR